MLIPKDAQAQGRFSPKPHTDKTPFYEVELNFNSFFYCTEILVFFVFIKTTCTTPCMLHNTMKLDESSRKIRNSTFIYINSFNEGNEAY